MRSGMALHLLFASVFAATINVRELLLPALQGARGGRSGFWEALWLSASRAPRRFGGYVVHLSIAVMSGVVAIYATAQVNAKGTLKPGEVMTLGAYSVRFDGLSRGQEPHRSWTAADVTLTFPSGRVATFSGKEGARLNTYARMTEPVGSPLVDAGVGHDVYVTLMAFDPATGTATLNAWLFPLVSWLWGAGMPLLVLGSLVSMWPAFRRRRETSAIPGTSGVSAA